MNKTDASLNTIKKNTSPPKWCLDDLYCSVSDKQIDVDIEKTSKKVERFRSMYHKKVASLTLTAFKTAMEEYEIIIDVSGKLHSYAYLLWTTDTQNPDFQKLLQRINEWTSNVSRSLIFFEIEWQAIKKDKATQFIESKQLCRWSHYLNKSHKHAIHVLDVAVEEALVLKKVSGRQAWIRYFNETLNTLRIQVDGETYTEQQALTKLHNPSRTIRKKFHKGFSQTLKAHQPTLSFIFNTLLYDKYTEDTLRHYNSWIDSRHLSNEVTSHTITALTDAVTQAYPMVQHYYSLKRKLLKYDILYDYDRYAPLNTSQPTISWNKAQDIVTQSYYQFSKEMGDIADLFFQNKWIDAQPKQGKRSGAYSASTVPSVHPYIFMNFDGNLRDVQTLAHELGHGIHQYLSRKQGVLQADTPLTTAEMASTFGEMLIFEHLLKGIKNNRDKQYLLIAKIDDSVATIFRQISMFHFENKIHNHRRTKGECLPEEMNTYWMETQKQLYGSAITITPEYQYWWSYIPHFIHTPGYVYAYAFGELLVFCLYDIYKEKGDDFVKPYLNILSQGGSQSPYQLLKELNIYIEEPSFWQRGLNIFEKMIKDAESLT